MKILLTTIFVAITLVACKKYDDGGYFSKTRIEGEWKTDKETITFFGQQLSPSDFPGESGLNFDLSFKDGGEFNYTIQSTGTSGVGTWKFSDDKEYVEMVGPSYDVKGLIKKYKGNELDLEFNLVEFMNGMGNGSALDSLDLGEFDTFLNTATYDLELVKI